MKRQELNGALTQTGHIMILNIYMFLITLHSWLIFWIDLIYVFCHSNSKDPKFNFISILFSGGFQQFEKIANDLCRRTEKTDDSIFGLCNLKISDDSGNGTSESDSENLNSPACMSPYPVEVLNHLYLGNAKNSADIDLLKKCGIKYILNVTPNVPNKFAEDSDFKYMQIPVADQLSQNLSAFFPEAIAFIGR